MITKSSLELFFKEIADKVYAGSLENSDEPELVLDEMSFPYSKHGSKNEINTVMRKMHVAVSDGADDSDWAVTKTNLDNVVLQNRIIQKGQMPNVMGMGLKDALYLLESQGLTVRVSGSGIVKNQSVIPGREIFKRQLVTIELI